MFQFLCKTHLFQSDCFLSSYIFLTFFLLSFELDCSLIVGAISNLNYRVCFGYRAKLQAQQNKLHENHTVINLQENFYREVKKCNSNIKYVLFV